MLRFSYVPGQGSERRSNQLTAPSCSSFNSIQSILPSIRLTKRRWKHLDAIQLVREQRQNHQQELAYQARPFVLCGIPLRRPPLHQFTHRRHSRKFFLEIIGHPQFGLPYGQDRLLPIWITTLALQQKSRVIRIRQGCPDPRLLQAAKRRSPHHRLAQGFQRLFAATIFFGTEDQPDRESIIDSARFHFFDHLCLWFNPPDHRTTPTPPGAPENVITLSEAFYAEIDAHRIPVEREVVAALAHAPGILDFYLWIVWRS
ncbi:MAG: replication protein RepA [Terriglobia bacterium]